MKKEMDGECFPHSPYFKIIKKGLDDLMITKINKSNSGSYKDLFYKVSQELMKHDASSFTEIDLGSPNAIIPCKAVTLTEDTYVADTFYIKNAEGKFERDTFGTFKEGEAYYEADMITSLNEYFHYIDRIKEIKGGMYTRLPIDENLFLIDADKRSITIPPAFASNGVSVQGDEVSETLYFKIDRYYDATDLAMQNVFVEWKNAAGEEGVSFPWIFDIESEPNYIIFGWPLSSKITKNAGTVQFTVRFYSRDEQDETAERLIYSFSTLTHSVSIKPGLNFNLVELLLKDNGAIDDATELISQRFTSSPLAGTDETASKPIFLDMEILGFVGPRQAAELEPSIYMNLGGDDYTEEIDLVTQAITEDAGQLSYSWKRKELIDNKTGNSIPFDSKPVFEMRLTQDTSAVAGKTYYQKDPDSNAYVQFVPSIWDENDEEYVAIYERFSVIKANSTGAYWVVAKNRVGSASEETQSATVIIPNPVTPVIAEGQDLPVKEILSEDNDNQVTLVSNAKTAVTKENPTGAGVLTYQWKRSETEDGEFINIDGGKEKSFIVGPNAAMMQKYKISHSPTGTEVKYLGKEVRVMCPANTQWVHQQSGETADKNSYYIGFKAYAPDNAVGFKEDLKQQIEDQTMYYFENNDFAGVESTGRKYSICWLPVAKYDQETETWSYHGKDLSESTGDFIGFYYAVEWYDENEEKISSDVIRINLSNEENFDLPKAGNVPEDTEEENGAITRPAGDGYYKVETTTSLNKEAKSIESGICRITHAASKMNVNCLSDLKTSLVNAQTEGLSVEALFPEACSEQYDFREDLGDAVTYQWYRYYAGNSNLETDLIKAAAGTYAVNGDDLLGDNKVKNPNDDPANPDDDFLIGDDTRYIDLGSQTPKFYPDVQGYYFCQVTNTFNGTTAVRCSDFFNVAEY